ncbi:hypothetical protein C8Q80DRAFT_1111378, partial [Daedaleopsis nitida]
RYDARLLLDSLPAIISSSAEALVEEPDSPSGWSDLPSDAEDTFFFSCAEAEDYRREKRRRVIDGDREARLQALRAEAGGDDDDLNAEEEWGGSDEEPDDGQHELMRRTASHIFTSPNPAQLEMRILANHGADTRFAFLRGRWSRAWRLAKAKARLESDTEKKRKEDEAKQSASGGMGGLAGYGDSDEEEDGEAEDQDAEEGDKGVDARDAESGTEVRENVAGAMPSNGEEGPAEVSATMTPDEDALKAARRARAREWAEKRRAAQPGNATDAPNGNE